MDELITKRDATEAVNDVLAEYIPTLRPWQSKIPLACAMKIKALPPVQTEIIHCKDCLYKKICSWKNQGAEFCSFGERGKQDGTD